MHVITPVVGSGSDIVVPGSQTVGGNIGTHLSPSSWVNGPHTALPTVSSAGWHLPSRSIVPSPHSTLLHPAAATAVASTRRMDRVMQPPRSGRCHLRDRRRSP